MSIRVRLALWYGAIFGATLLILGIGLYVIMARHLESMVEDAVVNHTTHLETAILSSNPDYSPGKEVIVPPLDTFESQQVYVQILDPEGTTIGRSSNLEGRSLPLPQGVLHQGAVRTSLDSVSIKVALTPVKVDGQTIGWVHVAASYRQREMVLERLRWAIVGGGLGAAVVVALISGALAGRALSPVSEMTETARAIALSRGFSRRLKIGEPNDELGRLAQTFNEMLASLEGAYSAQQRFTADASHELRAPLTAIRGNLDLLDRVENMPEEERQQTLVQIRREAERLSRLVNNLLSLARADAGQSISEVSPVELDALVVDAHRQALIMARDITVRLGALEPCIVQGDEDRLKELLLILVDNSLRYTPEGGEVTLHLTLEPPWAVIKVEDTGVGIDVDDLPYVFDRFWRADKARSRETEGTGLGLAIAKWIVDLHGGEILVESKPGEGSRFTVNLPASS